MKLLRSFFGSRAEGLEEKGDELKLASCWREAAWFYRKALEALNDGDDPARLRIEGKASDVCRSAFRELVERAEQLARRDERADALVVLREAEAYAQGPEERGILHGRRLEIDDFVPASAAPPGSEAEEGNGDERRFNERLASRSESEQRRLRGLGADGRAGFLALTDGDAAAAVEALRREVDEMPESAVGHELLGQAYERQGQYEPARVHFEAAYRRSPERAALALHVARLLVDRLKDPGKGLEWLERVSPRHRPAPDTQALHLERTFLLADAGRWEEATRVVDELLATPGLDRGYLFFNRSGLLVEQGRDDEAESDLLKAIESSPHNVLYLERMADFAFKNRQDPGRALHFLDRALVFDAHDFAARGGGGGPSPDRARLQFKAARVLLLQGQHEQAGRRVEEALVVCHDPRVEEALLNLRRELLHHGPDDPRTGGGGPGGEDREAG